MLVIAQAGVARGFPESKPMSASLKVRRSSTSEPVPPESATITPEGVLAVLDSLRCGNSTGVHAQRHTVVCKSDSAIGGTALLLSSCQSKLTRNHILRGADVRASSVLKLHACAGSTESCGRLCRRSK